MIIPVAFLGLIEQWLEIALIESPEEMADMYIKIIYFIRKCERGNVQARGYRDECMGLD